MENLELDELVYTYPVYDVKGIQTLISAKEEFREVSGMKVESEPKRGELFRHQKVIKRLMIQYDNLLLAHQAGSGKGCSFVSVTEHYKSLAGALEEIRTLSETDVNPPYKHAVILVKGQTLIDEIKFQILCKCTDGDYITDQILNSKTESARKGNVSRSIAKFYTVKTYGDFAKKLLKLNDEQLRNDFDNTIFIVDEVHNINNDKTGGILKIDPATGNEYYVRLKKDKKTGEKKEVVIESRLIYDQLWRLFHTVKPRKVMLSSATPMINSSRELSSRLNLILPEDNQIPENINYKTVSLETLEPYLRGLISYVRALDTGAIPVYQGKVIDATYSIDDELDEDEDEEENKPSEKDLQRLKNLNVDSGKTVKAQMVIYATEMDEKQSNVYKTAQDDPESLRPGSKNPAAFSDLERQVANFVFPDNSTGKIGYDKYVEQDGNEFIATKELYNWISDPNKLKTLSAKYYEIVRLSKSDPGNCWCYSDYIRGSGAIVLGLCFHAQGFENYSEGSSVFSSTGSGGLAPICSAKSLDDVKKDRFIRIPKRLRYALLTSETTGPEAASLLELFNSFENRHGEYIKAIIGSPVTRDGLNLANVLQIHLAGPGWNQASSYQAQSRAIRSTSHVDLIEEKKESLRKSGASQSEIENASIEIKVYRHAAINAEGTSIDFEMYQLSEIKDREIKRIERMMKQSAIDCQINYTRNVRPKDIDNSATCDYDICQYKCVDPLPKDIDTTSYDVLYSGDIIEGAKSEIVDIFRVVFTLPYPELYSEINGYRKKFIDLAVSQLVEEKTPITDRYGYLSYLREDRGTLFLKREYPLNIFEKKGAVAISEYSATLLGISTMTLNEYNGFSQRGKGNILDTLRDIEDYDDKIASLTLENRILLLETAITSYYIDKERNDIIEAVIIKFKPFIFISYEPIESLKISKDALEKRGTGRGRKPAKGSRFKLSEPQEENVEKGLSKLGKDIIYFHNLTAAGTALTAFAVTSKSRKVEGKIRMLKIGENIGWRDSNEYEEPVYNTYIKTKIEETSKELAEFEIYGTIMDDNKFRIVDKTTEDAEKSEKDSRNLNRGRICYNGWKKPKLFELVWKLEYNPFIIDIKLTKKQLIEFITTQGLADESEASEYSLERLNLYYSWGTSGANISKICDLIEEYLADNNRLFRT